MEVKKRKESHFWLAAGLVWAVQQQQWFTLEINTIFFSLTEDQRQHEIVFVFCWAATIFLYFVYFAFL